MHGIKWVPLLLCLLYITDIFGATITPWYGGNSNFDKFVTRPKGFNKLIDSDLETSQEGVPFCGYKRKINSKLSEFRVLGYMYDSKDLTYKISKYSKNLSRSTINTVISKAFEAWSDVADLTFTRKNGGSANIDIRFEVGSHGDNDPFDGLGNVLAHANYRYIHFDDSENWSTELRSGVSNLYAIAIHEIGHALGLDHTTVKNAIMYEFYNPNHVVLRLQSDDIRGIQSLYGAKSTRDDYDYENEDKDDNVYIPRTPVESKDAADDPRVPQIPSGFNGNDYT